MKKLLSITFLALLLPVSVLRAQVAEVLPFTRIDRDPVQAGLAGAGVWIDDQVQVFQRVPPDGISFIIQD